MTIIFFFVGFQFFFSFTCVPFRHLEKHGEEFNTKHIITPLCKHHNETTRQMAPNPRLVFPPLPPFGMKLNPTTSPKYILAFSFTSDKIFLNFSLSSLTFTLLSGRFVNFPFFFFFFSIGLE
ncbi:hypothetical protein QBC43DRAFT_326757 [Cladorrhinum sp. PSN259]|nr:hypothetical protein QBC43DRAFT_326757 [Cladorrhinum sp. PSN259]